MNDYSCRANVREMPVRSETPLRRLTAYLFGELLAASSVTLVYLGHNHPNVPAVTSPYKSPSKTSFHATFQGFPIQMAAGI